MKQIKKVLSLLLVALLFALSVTPALASNVKVKVGGELINFDVKPQIINGRTMVPLRKIFETLDATVEWNGETRTVTSTKGDTTISLTIDSPTMYVNGEAVALDTPACLIGGRTLVPVRAISEGFNLKVEWNDNTRTVRVRKPVSLLSEDSYGNKYTYDKNGNLLSRINSNVWDKYTYDENDNLTYNESSHGYWTKHGYDKYGNMILWDDSNGRRQKMEYNQDGVLIYLEQHNAYDEEVLWIKKNDEKGNIIYENEDGRVKTAKNTYDENGNLRYVKWSDGGWAKYEYDSKGNIIYYGTDEDFWQRFEFDEYGNMIRWFDNYGYDERVKYNENGIKIYNLILLNGDLSVEEYDEKGNIIYDKYNKTVRTAENTYDERGNLTYVKWSDGKWEKYEYDSNNNKTFEEKSDGYWKKYQYDSNGNLIYEEDSNGYWKKYIVMEI